MWATFIGSTLVHSPVPGERKSGIPDGTKMPAPVSATTRSDPQDQLGEALGFGREDGLPAANSTP